MDTRELNEGELVVSYRLNGRLVSRLFSLKSTPPGRLLRTVRERLEESIGKILKEAKRDERCGLNLNQK